MSTPRARPPMRPARLVVCCALLAVTGASACSDSDAPESPAPGGTLDQTDGSIVRAPNGTNMGAPGLNAGTPAP